MPRPLRLASACACVAALALAACSSTRIVSTWRDPALGPIQFRKVVGVALSQDATLRRLAEDAFVRAVGPELGVAGYAVIPDEEVRDRELARERVVASGADGVVVFRVAGVEDRQTWVPPTYYGSAWGYWGWAAPVVFDPGYLRTDRIVQVESNAYSVIDARLVWAARSETLNPEASRETIEEIVGAAVAEMREAGLLPKR
jgi:hypothetical protein